MHKLEPRKTCTKGNEIIAEVTGRNTETSDSRRSRFETLESPFSSLKGRCSVSRVPMAYTRENLDLQVVGGEFFRNRAPNA